MRTQLIALAFLLVIAITPDTVTSVRVKNLLQNNFAEQESTGNQQATENVVNKAEET